MIKKLSAYTALLGLVLMAGCSGSSSSPPPVPTPPTTAWNVAISAGAGEILTTQQVLVLATVTQNGDTAPDGTAVNFLCSTGGVFTATGTNEAVVATSGGKAGVYFTAPQAGSYIIQASVFTVKSQINIKVKNPDTTDKLEIFNIVPAQGSLDGGAQVTIYGKNIGTPVEVSFNVDGVLYAANVLNVDASGSSVQVVTPKITAADPTKTWGSDVVVRRGVGTPTEQSVTVPNGFTFTPTSGLPEIYQLFPDHGSPRGGDQVTVFGQNFKAPVRVQFTTNLGTVEATGVTVSDDGRQVQVITPQISAQPITEDLVAKVTLVNQAGTGNEKTVSKDNAFVFTADQLTPKISTVSPNFGPIEGGTQVTIFAEHTPSSGFQMPVQVIFGGGSISDHEAQIISVNQYEIVCLSPDITDDVGAGNLTPPIAVSIKVTNIEAGLSDTLAAAFTYGEALFISGNTPTEGPMEGNNLVTIFGSGFRSPLWVDYLHGTPPMRTEVVSVSGAELVVKMPAVEPPQCGDIVAAFRVTLTDSNAKTEGGQYKYRGITPLVLSVDPAIVGPPDADSVDIDELTINGRNFHSPVSVSINGLVFTEGTSSTTGVTVTLVDENTITLTGVRHAIGPLDIGLAYDTSACGTNGVGIQDVATAVPVTVTSVAANCSATLPGGLSYEPYDTTCRIPHILVAPIDVTFNNTVADDQGGNCDQQTFRITNVGTAYLIWNADLIGVNSDQFHLSPGTPGGTLAPNDSVDVAVDFCPTSTGMKSATVEVNSNDPDTPTVNVNLTGNGI
ncbi:MAG: choice-of-anchor D domain-containing protein [Acidobacteria bacterium]|nr:choice-of-anchor D domain-containing protein [Acidobacteriota bacterium]